MAKILLVEDDNNLREIYEARLQAEGYTIVSAHDGEEALVIAKSERPDLVISDIMMPKISGFEMLDIMRNTDGLKDVKIIMLTALGQVDDQQRANKLGADRYLVKSQVTLEDIVNASKELLGSSASTEDLVANSIPPAASATTPTEPQTAAVATDSQPPTVTPTEEPTIVPATPIAAPVSTDLNMSPTISPVEPAFAASTDSTVPQSGGTAASSASPAPDPDLTMPVPEASQATTASTPESLSEEENTVASQIVNFANAPANDPPEVSPVVTQIPISGPSEETRAQENPSATPVSEASDQPESAVPPGPGAAKKVIEPITPIDAKPDINELLAREEAAQAGGTVNPGPAASPTVESDNGVAL